MNFVLALVMAVLLIAVIVCSMIVTISGSLTVLREHRNGSFYAQYHRHVWGRELVLGIPAMMLTAGAMTLLVMGVLGNEFAVFFMVVLGAVGPCAIAIRALRMACIKPHGVIEYFGLNRRSNSAVTGPIRTSLPLAKEHYTSGLDTYDGPEGDD